MASLKEIETGISIKPRRLLLYGVHGIGKSTFASMAPSPIVIQTEDGLGNIDVAKFPVSRHYEDVIDSLLTLHKEKHDYKTVVLDSADWLERLIWAKVSKEKGVGNIAEIDYGKGYAQAVVYMERVLKGLSALRDAKGMTIIVIAHSKIEKFENPISENYDRYSPDLHKGAAALIQEWADEVLFATYKVRVKVTDKGFNQKSGRGIGEGERVMYCEERPSYQAKNRLGMPPEIAFEWTAYAGYFQGQKTEKGQGK